MSSLLENGLSAAEDDGRPGSQRAALLAGLPHLLVAGLLLSMSAWGLENAAVSWGLALAGGAALLIALAAAGRAGWPRWSASWAGYWLIAALAGVVWGGQALRLWSSQNTPLVLFLVVIAVGLPIAVYFVARRDRLSGLLLGLPLLMILWMPTLEFVPNAVRNTLQPAGWLALALTAYGLVRRGEVRWGYLLTLGLHLGLGAATAYSRAYLRVYPTEAPAHWRDSVPALAEFLYWFVPSLAAFSPLLVGPVLARALWQLGRLGGGWGAWASRLTFAGLCLALAGHFGSFANYLGWLGWPSTPRTWFLTTCVYAGLLLILAGAALFLTTPLRHSRPDRALIAALAAVLFGLPFAAILPLWAGYRIEPSDVPFGFLQVHLHLTEAYLVGLLWALGAISLALVLSRRAARPTPA